MELNTINSQSTWGKEVDNLNKNFQKVDDEMTKLQNATYKNKGYFSTVEKLKEAFPNATVGSKAYVGTSYPYDIWVWEDGAWKDSLKKGGDENLNLNEYIKEEDAINKLTELADSNRIYSKSDFDSYLTHNAVMVESNGSRIRMILKTDIRTYIEVASSLGKGVTCSVYDTFERAITCATIPYYDSIDGYRETLSVAYSPSLKGSLCSGYVVISLCKSDSSIFTPAEVTQYVNAVTLKMYGYDTYLRELDYSLLVSKKSSYTNADSIRRHVVSLPLESSDGNRLSVVFKCRKGDIIKCQSSYGVGVVCQVYNSIDEFCIGSDNYLQTFTSGYTTNAIRGIVEYDGYVGIKWKKSNETAITDSEKQQMLNSLKFTLETNYEDINNNKTDIENLKKDTVELADSNKIYSKSDFNYYLTHNAVMVESNGSRIRMILKTNIRTYIEVSSPLGKGVACSVYKTFADAILCAVYPYYENVNGYKETISVEYASSLKGSLCSGYVVISLCKTDSSIFSEEEITQYVNAVNLKMYGYGKYINENIANLGNSISGIVISNEGTNVKKLFLGTWVNKSLNSYGQLFEDSTVIVSQKSCIAVPYYGITIFAKLPESYQVAFKYGESTLDYDIYLSNDSGFIKNGESFTFPTSGQMFRVYLSKVDGSSVTNGEIQNLVDTGEISLTYISDDSNILERNRESEKYIKAVTRKFTNDINSNNSFTNLPCFAHISDVHSDATRFKSFIEYCDMVGIDAALVSGDVVAMSSYEEIDYINTIADNYNTKVLMCMGNHDARGNDTKFEQYNNVMKHLMSKYSLNTPASEEYPTYYYKDFPNKKFRVISFNQYEAGQYNTNYWHYTQEQLEWLVNTLLSTPLEYGIIIMMHGPENEIVKNEDCSEFYQDLSILPEQSYIKECPLLKIVDAFVSRAPLSLSFTQMVSGGQSTVNINVDFSDVDNSIEFIAFVNGHSHCDRIGYASNTTNKLLVLNIACGIALYGNSTYPYYANMVDVPRGGEGSTQDLFNIYAVDRESKNVRVARVGSNMNSDLKRRDYMSIPYKNI